MDDDGVTVSLEGLVRKTPQRNAGLDWPLPIDKRVDDLVHIATAAGENTTRKEIVAAVIADCTTDPDEIAKLLKRFRTMTVGGLFPELGNDDSKVVVLRPGAPARRKKTADP